MSLTEDQIFDIYKKNIIKANSINYKSRKVKCIHNIKNNKYLNE